MLTQLWLGKIKSSLLSLLPSNIYCVLDFYLCQHVAIKMDESDIYLCPPGHDLQVQTESPPFKKQEIQGLYAWDCSSTWPKLHLQGPTNHATWIWICNTAWKPFYRTLTLTYDCLNCFFSPFFIGVYTCLNLPVYYLCSYTNKKPSFEFLFFLILKTPWVLIVRFGKKTSSYSEISHLNNTCKVKGGAWFFI